MLLAKIVRRINKTNIPKCVNESIKVSDRGHQSLANNTLNALYLANSPMQNVTSTVVFTNGHRDNCYLWASRRYYSSQRNTKENKNEAEDDEDEDLTNWNRKLPRFDDSYVGRPSIYLMLKNALSSLLIRSYFDQNFNREEFLSGARHAIEVISNLLAAGDFNGLQDLVDDDTIAKMRQIVGSMTPKQRELLIVNDSDIQWIFPHEIQFITKENSITNKSRFFVEIMVVVHAFRDHEMIEIELSDILKTPDGEMFEQLEKNYSVANYRFIKEFTKGVEDDWTVNHIVHVLPTDEMKERQKLLKEL